MASISDILEGKRISIPSEDRCVFYIRLIGFSAFMIKGRRHENSDRGDEMKREGIDNFFAEMKKGKSIHDSFFIADSFCVFLKEEDVAFDEEKRFLAGALRQFIGMGFLFSGGISKGKMSISNNCYLGSPLTEAMQKQQGIALPRIGISHAARSVPWVKEYEVQEDGELYFDYLRFIIDVEKDPENLALLCDGVFKYEDCLRFRGKYKKQYLDFIKQIRDHKQLSDIRPEYEKTRAWVEKIANIKYGDE